nr:caldesmon-like [Solanum lycopersicum]
MQAENLSLRKNLEDEKVRTNNEVEEKIKESALRVSLESEVAGLKNEILPLKKKLVADDGGREIRELKEHLSERETKINELKELVKKERVRAESEKKKAELERKKADDLRTKLKILKTRANEERRLADTERKRAEVNRLSLENLKKEADQVKSKLSLVIFEFEDAKKKLEAERENTSKERKRADAAGMKTVEQKKIAEANRKMAMNEKSRATALFWQLEQDRQKVDNLKKEIGELMASGKMANIVSSEGTTVGTAQLSSELGPVAVDRDVTMVDVALNSDAAQRKLQKMELRVVDEKKCVKSEMKKVEKQRKAAEAYKKKASEEKDRADQLSEAVENYRKQVEELQKEIKKLISTRSLADCPLHMSDSNVHVETGKVKLLKKQLKFEKKLVKHVKKVAKLEKAHSNDTIQQQSLLSIKQEVVHFLRRLNMLDGCLFQDDEHDLEKVCSFNLKNNYSGLKARDMHRHLGNDSMKLAAVVSDPSKQKIKRSVPSLPICGGNNPESMSGYWWAHRKDVLLSHHQLNQLKENWT